jgi:hypothetical protein
MPPEPDARTRVSGKASWSDPDTFQILLAALDTDAAVPAEGASSSADRAALAQAKLLKTLNSKLQAVASDQDRFDEASHELLHALMDAPPHVQRQVSVEVLAKFSDKLSRLARVAADAALYAADVYDRYHPKEGLPRQYGWEVSPVKCGLYDVLIAALAPQDTLLDPWYRMPRLDQLADVLVRQAHDRDAPARGFAIARMASFFHQVSFCFKVDRSGEVPVIHIMPVDSEKRGIEIALQLREGLKRRACKANIAAINGGTQSSPAGCPIFSPFNIECMKADSQALDALLQRMSSGKPLHGKPVFSYGAGQDISIAVYEGEDFLGRAFYDICQSKHTRDHVAKRVQPALKTRMQDAIDNSGKTRNVNFLFEKTHEEKTGVMLGFLKKLLAEKPVDGNAKLKAHIRAVRQSSLGDDDDLKMDRPCAASQLADEVGDVVWSDISDLSPMDHNGRWQELLGALDRTDGPQRMKLGYLQKQGYPVFSDWYVEGECLYLKDDRYFHRFGDEKSQKMRPSEYMKTNSGIRADATYNWCTKSIRGCSKLR